MCSPLDMDDMQPIGPTRHYVIVCRAERIISVEEVCDGSRIEVDADSMWPSGSSLEFWATVEVIGPRHLCVRRIAASDVLQVEREDGAIWPT
jgi:hypothetical protein